MTSLKDCFYTINYQITALSLSFIFFSIFIFIFSKKFLYPYALRKLQKCSDKWPSAIGQSKILHMLPHILISILGFLLLEKLKIYHFVGHILHTFFLIYISLSLTFFSHRMVVLLENVIRNNESITSPSIRSYSQFISLLIFTVGIILTVCIVLNVSPTMFLGSLGAVAALLTLVFKDTLQSFIACVQISFNKLLLKGDFIKICEYDLEGNISDISLNFVKIKKTDGTIFVMPTYKILETPFKNYRNLAIEKSRRIKKAIFLDQDSIVFLNADLINKYKKNPLISSYIKNFDRYRTNSYLFREYLEAALKDDPLIRNDKTILVRFLDPTSEGIPLEIYAFTKDFDWVSHEKIKSQILEMIVASLKEFDLKVHQIS